MKADLHTFVICFFMLSVWSSTIPKFLTYWLDVIETSPNKCKQSIVIMLITHQPLGYFHWPNIVKISMYIAYDKSVLEQLDHLCCFVLQLYHIMFVSVVRYHYIHKVMAILLQMIQSYYSNLIAAVLKWSLFNVTIFNMGLDGESAYHCIAFNFICLYFFMNLIFFWGPENVCLLEP